jgi:hypothetical protein
MDNSLSAAALRLCDLIDAFSNIAKAACQGVDMGALKNAADELRAALDGQTATEDARGPNSVSTPAVNTSGAAHLIVFDDRDRVPEFWPDAKLAHKRFEDVSLAWNAHLYAKVKSNSRDDPHYSRNIAVDTAMPAEPVGQIVANDPVHGWHMKALKPWNEIGEGTMLYAGFPPRVTQSMVGVQDNIIDQLEALQKRLVSIRGKYGLRAPADLEALASILKAEHEQAISVAEAKRLTGPIDSNHEYSAALGRRAATRRIARDVAALLTDETAATFLIMIGVNHD